MKQETVMVMDLVMDLVMNLVMDLVMDLLIIMVHAYTAQITGIGSYRPS